MHTPWQKSALINQNSSTMLKFDAENLTLEMVTILWRTTRSDLHKEIVLVHVTLINAQPTTS